MSREYKFRAWHKTERHWIENFMELPLFAGLNMTLNHVSDIEVTEWTGLTDRNGKDIWEGDIVLVYGEYRLIEFKHAFWYLAGQETMREQSVLGGFGTMHDEQFKPLYRYDECEVVGNIYEHPDLLK